MTEKSFGAINEGFDSAFDSLSDGGNERIQKNGSLPEMEFHSNVKMGTLEKDEEEEKGEKENYGIFSYFDSCLEGDTQLAKTIRKFHKSVDLDKMFDKALPFTVLAAYIAYLITVIVMNSKKEMEKGFWCSGAGFLYILTCIIGTALVYFKIIKKYFGQTLHRKVVQPLSKKISRLWKSRIFRALCFLIIVGGLIVFYVIDTVNQRQRLVSFIGFFFILGFGFIFSHAPRKVVWRYTIWGMSLQFLLAVGVLRWPLGNRILQCLSVKISEFLAFSLEGSIFIFGCLADTSPTIFAFSVLPVTIFFSFCTNVLYYYGAIQWLVINLGWLLQVTVGTNLCESMNAAGSIFLGMTESPLLVKPYLSIMTNSELHAVMTAGFATIAGSVLAAYISLGADPALLITASVMNAPAALAISKLFYPNMEKSRINAQTVAAIKSNEVNALHAGCVGVTNAIPLVANIAANLIAFISFVAFFNAVFDWSCQLVNYDEGTCSLETAFGYIFMPLAWMMGVEWSDCYNVGQLIGLKIIINEFVAYTTLSDFIKEDVLSPRSEAIATFALCGFGNISAVGIMLGGLGPLAPERKDDMAKIAFRAMVAGSLATFSSACIAGTLLEYSSYDGSADNETLTTVLSTPLY